MENPSLERNAQMVCEPTGSSTVCEITYNQEITYSDWLLVAMWVLFLLSIFVLSTFFSNIMKK